MTVPIDCTAAVSPPLSSNPITSTSTHQKYIVSCHFEAFLACTSRPLMWRIRSHSRWRKKLCFSLGVSACRLTYICIYATPSWSILQVRTQKNSRNSLSEFQLKLDFMRGNGCLFCLVPDQANSVRLK